MKGTAGRALEEHSSRKVQCMQAKAACTRAGGERAATGRGERIRQVAGARPRIFCEREYCWYRLEDASEDALRAWSSPMQTIPGPGPKAAQLSSAAIKLGLLKRRRA